MNCGPGPWAGMSALGRGTVSARTTFKEYEHEEKSIRGMER
jgi:hypothetical protein